MGISSPSATVVPGEMFFSDSCPRSIRATASSAVIAPATKTFKRAVAVNNIKAFFPESKKLPALASQPVTAAIGQGTGTPLAGLQNICKNEDTHSSCACGPRRHFGSIYRRPIRRLPFAPAQGESLCARSSPSRGRLWRAGLPWGVSLARRIHFVASFCSAQAGATPPLHSTPSQYRREKRFVKREGGTASPEPHRKRQMHIFMTRLLGLVLPMPLVPNFRIPDNPRRCRARLSPRGAASSWRAAISCSGPT